MRDTALHAESRTRRRVAVVVVLVGVVLSSVVGSALLAVDDTAGDDGSPPADAATTPSPERSGVSLPASLDRLHRRDVTGSNVTVGVIDATGFETDRRPLAGRIAESRSFAPTGGVAGGGRNDHGTAAAALVARTAPDAELYLARVGSTDGVRTAVAWLLDRDVDVIVAPVAAYGKPGDGSSRVARAAAAAVDRGVVVVAPAGNLATRHWRGAFRPRGDGIHRFGDRTTLRLAGDVDRLRVWLSWPRERVGTAFDLRLYRVDGDRSRLVARSRPFPDDGTPNERIVTDVDPDGEYLLRLRGPTAARGVPIRIESPTHEVRPTTPAGSLVAPATGDGVLAVGAYDERDARVEPFSSVGAPRGPGVDLVAPDRLRTRAVPRGLVGSSAAAPYVAGVAALLLEVRPDATPRAVERLLERTARPVDPVTATPGSPGSTPPPSPEPGAERIENDTRLDRDGAGVVRPVRAVRDATNRTASDGSTGNATTPDRVPARTTVVV
ncbi:S8 family serine peptidase [Halobaculum sp. MBLA0147]|uniref:S8 family serine peptidase n=1 Tax=Halobaculum sp. MBLA0147 TaxID=3079934 RepID=UPI00352364AD